MRLEAQQQARDGGDNRTLEAVLAMEGVHGTIAQLGKAPREYAAALDVAVGGKLNYVVVEDDTVASSAIGYLKENKLGRATFLPLNKLRPVELPVLKGDGIINYAVHLVEFDPEFESAFRVVLGATVVVDTLEKARRMMGRHRMVTLEGELLEKSGAMTGGHLKRGRGFGVAAGDETAQVRLALAALAEEASACDEAIAVLAKKVEDARGRRSGIEEQIARYSILLEEYEKRIQAIAPEREELEKTVAGMREEVSGSSEELASIEGSVAGVNKEITLLTKEIDDLKGRLEDKSIPALVEKVEKARQDLEEKDRRLRNKDTDIADKQRERQYFTKRIEELGTEQKKIAEKNAGIDSDITVAEGQITAHRGVITECEEKQKTFSRELEALRKKRDAIAGKIRTVEHKAMELGSDVERIRVQITALDEKARTLAAEIESLKPSAGEEESELTLEEIAGGIKKSEEEIARLGAVNMLAVEEYDRVNTRVAERTERKETLSRERTTIIERIDKYEKMKYEAFSTAFSAIDGNFREIFARLTSGTGKLVLDNEEDPFAGGLTFAVQPRDKTVRLLSALSGGEKSLTTLAFIFSIQKFMPAPFYALDEVDMFLDGYNVERIATMIRELSTNVQSVIVSLRKPMIESADRIIGVTLRPDKSTLVTGVKGNG
jgi:chromosome segregation protein